MLDRIQRKMIAIMMGLRMKAGQEPREFYQHKHEVTVPRTTETRTLEQVVGTTSCGLECPYREGTQWQLLERLACFVSQSRRTCHEAQFVQATVR